MASPRNLFLIFCAVVAIAVLVSADESKAKGVAIEHYEGGHGGSYEDEQGGLAAVGPGGPYKGGPGGGSKGGPGRGGGRKGCPHGC